MSRGGGHLCARRFFCLVFPVHDDRRLNAVRLDAYRATARGRPARSDETGEKGVSQKQQGMNERLC